MFSTIYRLITMLTELHDLCMQFACNAPQKANNHEMLWSKQLLIFTLMSADLSKHTTTMTHKHFF